MNCHKCGSVLTENDQYCKNCGAAVNAQNEQTFVQTPVQTTVEQPTSSEASVMQQSVSSQPDMVQSQVNNQPDTPQQVVNSQPDLEQQPTNNQPIMAQQPVSNQPDLIQQPVNNTTTTQNGWQNAYNPTPNYQPQKSSGAIKYIAIGVAIVVAIFVGIFVYNSMSNKDNYGNNNGSQNVLKNNSYKVNFRNFIFTIPGNLIYEIDNNLLLIGNEAGTWAVQLEVEQGSFSQLKANISQLQLLMQQNGYNSTEAVEKTLGGVEYITLEISSAGQNAIAALAKANTMYFICITAMNLDNEFDYSLLETIAPIISSVESSSSATNNLSINTTIDISNFAELAR